MLPNNNSKNSDPSLTTSRNSMTLKQLLWDPMNSKITPSMSANGKMVSDMEEENNYGKTDLSMKAIGKTIWHMEGED